MNNYSAPTVRENVDQLLLLESRNHHTKTQPPDLEVDFLTDSGAESNIFDVNTWNEIQSLNPNMILQGTASK